MIPTASITLNGEDGAATALPIIPSRADPESFLEPVPGLLGIATYRKTEVPTSDEIALSVVDGAPRESRGRIWFRTGVLIGTLKYLTQVVSTGPSKRGQTASESVL